MKIKTYFVVMPFILFGLSACNIAPKESSLAQQIRDRGEARLDIAENIEQGEAKIAKAERLLRDSAELAKEAEKAEKRAKSLAEEAEKLRSESASLKQEAEKMAAEGKAQVSKAIGEYEVLRSGKLLELPSSPTP